jgi:hypothetical protein
MGEIYLVVSFGINPQIPQAIIARMAGKTHAFIDAYPVYMVIGMICLQRLTLDLLPDYPCELKT